jgi:lipopolysaccharide exporter
VAVLGDANATSASDVVSSTTTAQVRRSAWLRRLGPLLASRRGGLAANAAVLAGGTALGQALTVIASPLLTRLYGPNDLGRLGLYMAFVNVATVATSLRYENGIVAARTNREAAHLTLIAVLLVVPLSIMFSVGLLVLTRQGLLGFDALPGSAALLVLFSLLVTGATSGFRYWFVREEAFGLVARVTVWQNGARSIAQVALGLVGLGWGGLLIGDLLGRLIGVGRLVRLSWPSLVEHLSALDRAALRDSLWTWRKLPIYDLPSSLVDTLAVGLTVPLISQSYGTEAAGYVSLVLSVLSLPVGVVSRSVADVFHARMALYARTNSAHMMRLFLMTTGTLLLVGLPPTGAVMLLGPLLFPWLFGASWVTAGHLAAEIAPWVLASLVVAPVSRVVIVFQAQELKLIYDLVSLAALVCPLLLAGALRLDLLDSMKFLSVAKVAAYCVYFAVLVFVVRRATLRSVSLRSIA